MANKIKLFIAICYVCCFVNTAAAQNCDSEFEFRSDLKNNGYELILTNLSDKAIFEFKLYDLNSGQFVAQKKLNFIKGESKTVFLSLKQSRYTVYVYKTGCNKPISLGGPTGIDLTAER